MEICVSIGAKATATTRTAATQLTLLRSKVKDSAKYDEAEGVEEEIHALAFWGQVVSRLASLDSHRLLPGLKKGSLGYGRLRGSHSPLPHTLTSGDNRPEPREGSAEEKRRRWGLVGGHRGLFFYFI